MIPKRAAARAQPGMAYGAGSSCREESMSMRATAEAAQASWGQPSSMPASPAAVAGQRVGIVRIASISLACATDNGRRLHRRLTSLANLVEHEHPTAGGAWGGTAQCGHTRMQRVQLGVPGPAAHAAAPHPRCEALSYAMRWWQLCPAPQQQGELGGPPGGPAQVRGQPGAGPAGGCRGRCAVLALPLPPAAAAAPCTARLWGSCPWGRPWRG